MLCGTMLLEMILFCGLYRVILCYIMLNYVVYQELEHHGSIRVTSLVGVMEVF